MEALALSSWVRNPENYKSIPLLTETEVNNAVDMIIEHEAEFEADQEKYSAMTIPNVLLVGAQETGTTNAS